MSDSRRVVIRHEPYNAETPIAALAEALTPVGTHYVRSNFDVPAIAPSNYTLRIDGAVSEAATLDWTALNALPTVGQVVTMECAGNDRLGMRPVPDGEPWASGAVSTAEWRGVRLRDALAAVTLAPEVTEILITGADSGPRDDAAEDGPVTFARSLPLTVALDGNTLLATEMNGAPLAPEHGAPVRLVVPGWYGMANVKWVVRLTALREAYGGYFQRQRYVYDVAGGVSPVTQARVKSLITAPQEGDTLPAGAYTIRGWAWSGAAPIAQVEVSVGGGEVWQSATLGTAPGPHAWTPWSLTVRALPAGRLTLRSRATDSLGARQPDVITWNRLGYGNNAVRPVTVYVNP